MDSTPTGRTAVTNFLKAYCLMTYLERHPMAEASMGARIKAADTLLSKTDQAIARHGMDDWETVRQVAHDEAYPLIRYDLETDRLARDRARTNYESPKEDCDA